MLSAAMTSYCHVHHVPSTLMDMHFSSAALLTGKSRLTHQEQSQPPGHRTITAIVWYDLTWRVPSWAAYHWLHRCLATHQQSHLHAVPGCPDFVCTYAGTMVICNAPPASITLS